ncbi:nose resistant to fluoxetine protein 6-like isoform X2 [Nasonia vitripennis]|uniref:Nose resistant-to-fluoxetine protein N-terminal domain-containing protein n=1 Tax=Nasonia vitripennis TaxID=7425 RepID=A0A7M7GBY2_NASVI|nr:nose resistant to fluoxetine protein 6-like isoform X2 [Nasonia vitripennis]
MCKKAVVTLVFLALLQNGTAEAPEREEILRRTLPVYGLAAAASSSVLEGSDDAKCRSELELFRRAVDDGILWAMKMLDSSGEPKPGFIYGNNYWLGSRSQCLDTRNRAPFVLHSDVMGNNSRLREPSQEFPPYGVNYFVAYFRHNSTMQYHVRLPNEDLVSLGLCLPDSCSTSELGEILSAMFKERSLIVGDLYSADFRLVQVRDLKDDHLWLLNGRIIFIKLVVASILALMLVGTAYDVMLRRERVVFEKEESELCENNNERIKLSDNLEAAVVKRKGKPAVMGKILLCFSVYSNTRTIFSTKLNSNSVAPIHGLRFLGMVWIIMIHTIFYMSDYADNKPWSWRIAEGFAVQVISNSTLSVDTFFFLSGFLVAYMYLTAHRDDRPGKPNYGLKVLEFIVTLLRRFIRLTPAYMMMVGILQLNASWYGRTSQFHMTERPHETCEKYWWRNVLYINNLFGRDTMCMSWSWYLSNDMQFFIIGIFLLILSSVYFKTAAVILLCLLIGSITSTGYIAYINDYVPTMDQQYHMLDVLYDPPWTRIGPYIVGMITAYIVIRLNNKLELRRRTVVTGWLLGSSCNLVVLFGLVDKQISVLLSAFYVAFSRTVWAIGLAWLLVACCTKHGGIVNKILCFKAWIPLSRLTYCAYLLNPFLINSIYLHSESAVHVDFLPNGAIFLGNLMMTYLCSYALSLMLETPTVLLMRSFFGVRKR